MAAHALEHSRNAAAERTRLGDGAKTVVTGGFALGLAGIALAIVLGLFAGAGFRRFYFAYLVAFCFFLTITLGAMVFILLQHLTRAGWSVTVRRVAEAMTLAFPALAVLSVPLLVSVITNNGDLYRWALPMSTAEHHPEQVTRALAAPPNRAGRNPSETPQAAEGAEPEKEVDLASTWNDRGSRTLDELTLKKRAWLNPTFFILRVIFYFAVWSLLSRWFWLQSTRQDGTGDLEYTNRMQRLAPIGLILTGITLTGAAFDFVMSIDPHWYSTMFGVYFFAGAFVSFFAALIVAVALLQRAGYLRASIGTEHYHDLGKFLFGFTFFWGYIAFSQYMLLWYANIPEETEWFKRHGATTVRGDVTGWSYVIIAILFGHIVIPFLGLLSRHVKRRVGPLVFWAAWILVFHFIDLYWVVLPEMGKGLSPGLIDLAALIGVGGIVIGSVIAALRTASLVPTADPRLPQALAFQNI